MPELPEVETVKRGLAPFMEGANITNVKVNRPNLRFPFPTDFVEKLVGQTVISLKRRAKYILVNLSNDLTLTIHLGMSGSFRIMGENVEQPEFKNKNSVHDHVIFELVSKNQEPCCVIYNDPRRFGYMDLIANSELSEHPYFCKLGIEPLGNEFSSEYLLNQLQGRTTTLKAALLDQSIIAGLGNIYVCEALWRAKLPPKLTANVFLSKRKKLKISMDLLVESIRAVLNSAIEAGGSSLRDHVLTDGSMGYFQREFAVYGREGLMCMRNGCKGTIARIVQNGRSTFYCNSCQKY